MKKISGLIISLFLFSLICTSYAGATIAEFEFGDAVGYGQAKHNNQTWQYLGVGWSQEDTQQDPDTFDDGVSWSVNGSSWKLWGDNVLNLKQGDTVKFKFTVTRANYGIHPYDDLGVWLDLNGDGDWSDSGENIFFERMNKTDDWGSGSGQIPDKLQTNKQYETKDFFSGDITVGTSFTTGDTWLRARVSCSESINGLQGKFDDDGNLEGNYFKDGTEALTWNAGSHIQATGHLWQGETEDYRMHVAPVPVPGAVWLLGSGLLGLVGVRRRSQS